MNSERIFSLLVLSLFVVATTGQAQEAGWLVPAPLLEAVADEYSGEVARESIRQITLLHRIQASSGMLQASELVANHALRVGLEEIHGESFPSDGKTRYQSYVGPLAWTVNEGELWVEAPFVGRLCRFSEVPVCLSTLSNGGEWRGELIEVGSGTKPADYDGKDVRGKIVLASGYAGVVHREAVIRRGALGVVIYPEESDRPEHPDLVRYNGLWPTAEEKDKVTFGFQVSARQRDRLKAALAQGKKVVLDAKVDARIQPGNLHVLSAILRGRERPDEEVIFIAHLDHYKPGANDNASGSATLLEIARTIKKLTAEGKIPPPKRTLRFLWVPEHFGTIAYLEAHPEFSKRALAVLNLDMVGEDIYKTNSRLRITRTPDSLPSWLNDLVENVAQQVAARRIVDSTGTRNLFHWEMTPYDPGSDHDMMNDSTVAVPALMLGHWPDWTHHTNEDSVDKVDPTTLKRVGVLATTAGLWMANAKQDEAAALLALMRRHALGRIGERPLRATVTREAAALESVRKLSDSPRVEAAVQEAVNALRQAAAQMGWLGTPPVTKPMGLEARTPYRMYRGPLADSYGSQWFREQMGAKYAEWEELRGKVGRARFDLVVYETANFADGNHTVAEIDELIRAEYPETPSFAVQQIVEKLVGAGLMGYVLKKEMIAKPAAESEKPKTEQPAKPAAPPRKKR